jgi:hypothetical protein
MDLLKDYGNEASPSTKTNLKKTKIRLLVYSKISTSEFLKSKPPLGLL